jgi:hypothetical protein
LRPAACCGKIAFTFGRGGDLPHTYHGLIVNPDWERAEKAVRDAANENGGELKKFDREEPNRAHARVKFDTKEKAERKLQPMKEGIERRGYQTFENRVEDD